MLKELKQQFIKDTIVAEMKKQLLEKGIQKTTLRGIAKELGIAFGNIYYYFKTKADIGDVIWAEFTNEYLDKFKKTMKTSEFQSKTGIEKLRYYYQNLYDYFVENPLYADLIAFLMGEKPRSIRAPKEIRELTDKAREAIENSLTELYEEGISDGSIKANIPNLTLEVWSFNVAYVALIANIIRYHEINKNMYEYFVENYLKRLSISGG
ncbi:MAG: TetR/AcrR family transcriptional regulator [Candidatus Cloacimonetes bacterium]|nr:TetR/AcrR family transcriptional regulator [Candidatus Cloacimonadota bacterium]